MKDTYFELTITPSSERDRFVDFLFSLEQSAIEECGLSLVLRSEENLEVVKFGVEHYARRLSETLNKEINVKTKLDEKENKDWIERYKNSIEPVIVGDFYIHPTWQKSRDDKINILIDPALAFGSGHHESTFGCLKMLQKYVKSGDNVLDVGCGSGILSIASAKLGAQVDACDTDELAVKSTCSNFDLNSQKLQNCWVGSVDRSEKKYDVVVANIVADILKMLSKSLQDRMKKDGVLILSGILDRYVDEVELKFSNLEILEKYKKNEWYTLVFKKVVDE